MPCGGPGAQARRRQGARAGHSRSYGDGHLESGSKCPESEVPTHFSGPRRRARKARERGESVDPSSECNTASADVSGIEKASELLIQDTRSLTQDAVRRPGRSGAPPARRASEP